MANAMLPSLLAKWTHLVKPGRGEVCQMVDWWKFYGFKLWVFVRFGMSGASAALRMVLPAQTIDVDCDCLEKNL